MDTKIILSRIDAYLTGLLELYTNKKVSVKQAKDWGLNHKEDNEIILRYNPKDAVNKTRNGFLVDFYRTIGQDLFSESAYLSGIPMGIYGTLIQDPFIQFKILKLQNAFLSFLSLFQRMKVERDMMNYYYGTQEMFFENAENSLAYEKTAITQPLKDFELFLKQSYYWMFNKEINETKSDRLTQAFDEAKMFFDDFLKQPISKNALTILLKDVWPIAERLLDKPPESEDKKQKDQIQNINNFIDKKLGDGKGDGGSSDNEPLKLPMEIGEEELETKDLQRMKLNSEILNDGLASKGKTFFNEVSSELEAELKLSSNAPIKHDRMTYDMVIAQYSPQIKKLTQYLKSIIDDNRQDRHGGSFRRGKLNPRKLYKWGMKNYRLFSKKIMRQNKEYHFSLLIDESGSMSGKRMFEAFKATIIVAEALFRTKVDVEIIGFNETLRLIKSFNEPLSQEVKRKFNYCFDSLEQNGGSTSLVSAHYASNKRLLNYSGKKTIITLTDGEPNNKAGNFPQDLKGCKKQDYSSATVENQIKFANKIGLAIGIGIQTKAVQEFYPINFVCNDVKSLPYLLSKCIKRQVKRM